MLVKIDDDGIQPPIGDFPSTKPGTALAKIYRTQPSASAAVSPFPIRPLCKPLRTDNVQALYDPNLVV